MVNDPSAISLDTLLDFVSDFVKRRYESKGARTNGTMLAEAVRSRFPDFSFADVGLTRLSDLIRVAEQRGALYRHRDVLHLEVSPDSSTPRSVPTQAQRAPFQRVRPDLWRAFLYVGQTGTKYIDRSTGEITDLAGNRSQLDEERYAHIKAIDPKTQQGWMREFLASSPDLPEAAAPIDGTQWWVSFPAWVQRNSPSSTSEWRRFRTRKTVEYLRTWAEENNVQTDLLFVAQASKPSTEFEEKGHTSSQDKTRNAILAALNEMPLDELRHLSIPFKYLAPHFQAR